jgi:catechol 2,3-dioxygenase-like lactoylglutathione lyase family enzyme
MLSDHPIDVIMLAPDLTRSREFYADKLGLKVVSEDEHTVVFECGGASRIVVSSSTTGTADEQTQASWRVDDLAAELAELRARGVEVLEYDTPQIKTQDGIFDTGDALHAWITDPGRNVLGIDQYKR